MGRCPVLVASTCGAVLSATPSHPRRPRRKLGTRKAYPCCRDFLCTYAFTRSRWEGQAAGVSRTKQLRKIAMSVCASPVERSYLGTALETGRRSSNT
ncbi:hypothetical protein IG631_08544 [Alternaria alternata]|nr:hypothetical protein IG631_08544 [Alternaria alternata]